MNRIEALQILKDNPISTTALLHLLENRVNKIQSNIENYHEQIDYYKKAIEEDQEKIKEDKQVLDALKVLVNQE